MRQCEIVVPTMPVRFYLLRIGVGNNRCHKQTVLFRPACCLGLGSGCSERAVSRLCRRIRSANRISRQLSAATSTVTLRTLTHLRVRVVRGLSRAPLRRRSTAEESGPEHRTWRKGTPAAPATWELTIRSGRCTRRRSTASGICSSRPARYPKTRPRPPARTATCPRETMKCARAWGFLAVRLPLPEDPQWKQDQVTIVKGESEALGVLDPEGNPTDPAGSRQKGGRDAADPRGLAERAQSHHRSLQRVSLGQLR